MAIGRRKRWVAISAAVAATVAGGQRARAGTYFWEGDNGSVWNTNTGTFASNWSSQLTANIDPGSIPGAGDDVFFYGLGAPSGPINTTLGQNFSIRSLTYLGNNTDAVSIDGSGVNTLTIGAGGISMFGAPLSNNQISANVIVGANQTWLNNVTGGTLTVSGVVSGTSALTTAGAGQIALSNANTLSGDLILASAGNAVTFAGANASALNLASLTINGGAILNLDSSNQNHATQNRLRDNMTVTSAGGTFNLLGNGSAATTETVGTLQVNSGHTQINVTGAGGSAITFGSAAISSLSHGVGGTINFNPASGTAINLPNVTLNNGIIAGWATIGSTTSSDSSNTLDFATVSGGSVAPLSTYQTGDYATWQASDNVKVSNTQNVADASKTINSLYMTGSSLITFGAGGAVTNSANTLVIGSGGIISNGATGSTGINNQPTLQNIALIGSAPAADNANSTNYSGKITSATGELTITTASNLQINSIITNNGTTVVSLTKNGAGLLDLSAGNKQNQISNGTPAVTEIANTYTGITTINAGTILVNDDQNLGAVPTTVVANQLTLNGGTLLTTRGFNFASNRGILVGPQGGTLAYNGGGTWTIAQKISGPGGVTFSAIPGGFASNNNLTFALGSPAGSNSYQGPTVLNAQKASSGTSATIIWNVNEQIPDASAVTITGDPGTGAINMNNKAESIGSLASDSGVGKITNLGAFTTGNNNLSTRYGGTIAGNGSFTKVGGGVQTLTGNNTYTGVTNINGGTLLINGAPTGTGAFSVNNGGALGGNGTILAPVTVNTGGALAPAINSSTPSTLNINNNVTLASGANLNFLLGSSGFNDLVNVSGPGKTLTLSGSDILNINDIAGFGLGSYTLLQTLNGAVLNDTASFIIRGSTDFNYAISATNGAGGSIVLTVLQGNPASIWTGAASNVWNTSPSTINWQSKSLPVTPKPWTDGENAIFDSTSIARNNISVVADGVKPNSMEFDNASFAYTFSGGPITSTGNFTKNLAGNVTFNNTVSVGVASINGGSVTVAGGGSLTSPSLTVTLAGVLNVAANGTLGVATTVQSDGVTNFNNTTQTLTGLNGAATGLVNLNGPTTLTVGSGTFNGVISGVGSNLTINSPLGGGTLILNGINTYTGPTAVINGTLIAGGNVAPGVAGPLGNASSTITVGAASGSGSASLLLGGPFTITRDVVITDGNTGTNALGVSTSDTVNFNNTITLANTNSATLLSGPGTINVNGILTGAGGVNISGSVVNYNGSSAAYTGPTLVSSGTLNIPVSLTNSSAISMSGGTFNAPGIVTAPTITMSGGAFNASGTVAGTILMTGGTFNSSGIVNAAKLTVGPGTYSLTSGTLTSTNAVTIPPGGTFNFSGTAATAAVPMFKVSAPGTVNAQLTFASGVSYTNTVNILGAGFVTISATDTANANLIAGPINLSGAGGVALTVVQSATAVPANTYNGRINISGGSGTNGVDGILQLRYGATNTTQQVGLFTNVHLANNSGVNIGLVPSAASPRPNIVVDLTLDGTSAFLSGNSDGGSPGYVRDVGGTNPGSVLNLFALDGSNVANLNSANTNVAGTFTPLNAKSMNFVGSLNPNITVLNGETPPSGVNLTSNTNITSVANPAVPASFFLNGGTFQTGTLGTNTGTTTLVATTASPGTSGTFLVTAGGTFNVNRSADATLTYQGGTLKINADQNLVAFNIGNGVDALSFDVPGIAITTANLNVANNATINANSGTFVSGPSRIDGTLLLNGANVTIGTISGTGQVNLALVSPELITGDATSATFGGTIIGAGSINKQGTGVWTVSGIANTYTGPTTVNAGTLRVTGSIATTPSVTVNTGGTFEAAAVQTLPLLMVNDGGLATVTAGSLKVGDNTISAPLALTGSGKVDLKSRGMAIDYVSSGATDDATALSSVRAQIIAGRGIGGDYKNPASGITSSTAAANSLGAVGYALASDVLPFKDGVSDVFMGNTVDKSTILVRYTLAGDLNLDGAVDFLDLARLAQSYNVTNGTRQWSTGDVNFDGNTDFLDLAKLAQNYNTALPSAPIPGASVQFNADLARAFASVPEPGFLSILALAPLLGGRRRRRRQS